MEFADRSQNLAQPTGNRYGISAGAGLTVIIVVILYPVFAAPRSCGCGQETCTSNMKQLGLGLMQYAQDYDEKLPIRQYNGNKGTVVSWRQEVMPYVKARNVFRDPTDSALKLPDIEHDGFPRSFAVNSLWSGNGGYSGPFADATGGTTSMDKLPSPASTILITKSTAAYNDMNVLAPAQFMSPTRRHSNPGHLFAHTWDGKALTAILYSDGHVKTVVPIGDAKLPSQWTIDGSPLTPQDYATTRNVIDYGVAHSPVDQQATPQ